MFEGTPPDSCGSTRDAIPATTMPFPESRKKSLLLYPTITVPPYKLESTKSANQGSLGDAPSFMHVSEGMHDFIGVPLWLALLIKQKDEIIFLAWGEYIQPLIPCSAKQKTASISAQAEENGLMTNPMTPATHALHPS
jgi:hypothetical protein